jgi:hypothetical protein
MTYSPNDVSQTQVLAEKMLSINEQLMGHVTHQQDRLDIAASRLTEIEKRIWALVLGQCIVILGLVLVLYQVTR